MELSEYQRLFAPHRRVSRARRGWPTRRSGLAGEAGEVAEHAKKAIRDDGGQSSATERRAAMAKELGDVLWYVAQLASELDLDLDDDRRGRTSRSCSRASAAGCSRAAATIARRR